MKRTNVVPITFAGEQTVGVNSLWRRAEAVGIGLAQFCTLKVWRVKLLGELTPATQTKVCYLVVLWNGINRSAGDAQAPRVATCFIMSLTWEGSDNTPVKRKLWFGLALVLALSSAYVGLLTTWQLVQYTLAGAAVVAAIAGVLCGDE